MSIDSCCSVGKAVVEDAEEVFHPWWRGAEAEKKEPDANLKRPVDDAEEPVIKRQKASNIVSEMMDSVCGALSKTDIAIPWYASFRELLSTLLPISLSILPGQRKSSDDMMLRMLDEIFNVEEERMKALVAKTQHCIDAIKKKRSRATEAMNSAEEELENITKNIKEQWQVLSEDASLVFFAENKWRHSVEALLGKQKDAVVALKHNCFEPLKAASFKNDTEQQSHVVALTFLMEHIADDGLVESCANVLSKEIDDRDNFCVVVIQQVEDCLDKYISLLGLLSRNVVAAVQETAPAVDKMTFEQAEALMTEVRRGQCCDYRALAIDARKSFIILKNGFDGKPGKHINLLKRMCRNCPDSKAFVEIFPKVLEKMPDARSESDDKVVQKLQDVLDQRIASLETQLGKDGLAILISQQQLESCVNDIQKFIEKEIQLRDHIFDKSTKEKKVLLDLKNGAFDTLRDGSWTSPEVPKSLMTSVKKLFKLIDMDAPTAKTLSCVLKKKPDDRGTFDKILVTQFEETVRKRLATFEETVLPVNEIGKYEIVKQASKTVNRTQEERGIAREQQQTRLGVALGAVKERRRLELAVEHKMINMKERVEEEEQAVIVNAEKHANLETLQKARADLAFLRDRSEGGDPQ